MPKIEVELPRYTVPKPRKGGLAFYFQVPAKQRPEGWPAALRITDENGDPVTDPVRAAEAATKINERLDAVRAQIEAGVATLVHGSIPWLVVEYKKLEKWTTLAPRTRRGYLRYLAWLEAWSRAAGHPHISKLGPKAIKRYLATYNHVPVERDRLRATLSNLFQVAVGEEEIPRNPLREMDAPIKSKPRKATIWTRAEFNKICAVAIKRNRLSVALACTFMLELAQREGDALAWERSWEQPDGRLRFVQSKRKKEVALLITDELRRRMDMGLAQPVIHARYVVASEETKNRYDPNPELPNSNFAKIFREIRAEAGLPYLQVMYLRHTGVVERARAGLSIAQIATHTGHSPKTAYTIIERYMPDDEKVALEASLRLAEWRKEQNDD